MERHIKQQNLFTEVNRFLLFGALALFGQLLDEIAEVVVDILNLALKRFLFQMRLVDFFQIAGTQHLVNAIRVYAKLVFSASPPVIVVSENTIDGEITIAIVLTEAFRMVDTNFLLSDTKSVGELSFNQRFSCQSFLSQISERTNQADFFYRHIHDVH